MDIIIIYVIFFLLILIYLIIDYRNNKIKNKVNMDILYMKKNMNKNVNINNMENVNNISEFENVNECRVPTLSTGQCFKSRFFPCNPKNGSFEQCTNNIMPKNFNALCENRAFEMAKPEHKVSENCAYYYGLN
jgi:hypothetical protein